MAARFENLTIVIPAYNEMATIASVVSGFLPIAGSVFVVDDCSSDETGSRAAAAGAIVLKNEKNLGYDGSVARGLNEAFARGADVAVTADADGQHTPKAVADVAEAVIRDGFDFAAGIRSHYNRPIEFAVGVPSRFLYGTSDPFCGLKAYGPAMKNASGDFPAEMHIGLLPLKIASQKKLRVKFLPIEVKPRADHPRFGTEFRASLKLARAFLMSLFTRV